MMLTKIKESGKVYRSKPEAIEKRKTYHSAYNKEYRKRPDVAVKIFARNYLANAIRDRKINREPCAECGEEQVEGHHPDYDIGSSKKYRR